MSKSYDKYRVQHTQNSSGKSYDKYRMMPKEEGDSWPALIGKSALKGITSIADLPQTIGSIAEQSLNPEYSALGQARKLYNNFTNKPHEELNGPNYISSLPLATSKIKGAVKDYTGVDLEPHPTTGGQRILSHAADFAGSIGPWGFLSKGAGALKAAKLAGTGAGIGGTSGVLQEGGVNPLSADIASTLALPLGAAGITSAAKGTGNLLSRFSSKAQNQKLNNAAGNILKERVGEKNIPTVLNRLENTEFPLGTNPTTAEIAQNTGISSLHRAMAPNIPAIAEKTTANNSLIRKNLDKLGDVELTSELAGENIRKPIARNLDQALATRAAETTPLYEKVNQLKTGVNLPKTNEFLKNEGKYAKGDIKKNLKYIEDITRSNSASKKEIANFDKLYGNLGEGAQAQLKNNILDNLLPIEITNALKDISGRIGAAKKSGNNEVARILSEAKANILADMASIPEEQLARLTYANLSKPVSAIEKEPLLGKIVKKDQFGQEFIVSPEKIPDMVLNGTLNNTRALLAQVGKDPNTMEVVRGSIVNKLLNSSLLSSGENTLSYDKVNKFLKKNKDKLNLIFDKDQVKVLEDTREILRKRNMVATMGRAAGSNTQSETTLLSALTNPVSDSVTSNIARKIPGVKYLQLIHEAAMGHEKQQVKALLEKALLEPQIAKSLLMPLNKIKNEQGLKSILGQIYPASLISPIANDLNANREE